ncbi:helix-turn-helix domain-containing protein [Amycolatopsis sp. H6(2020)]|nr:helix-turn-helix domain-containing protein [Amycolatopsis sp. H6(2020)]
MDGLGEFLRSRRARLSPEDAELGRYGGRRRVPGLRREELAQLAGVSVAYYTRLEQGQSRNASDAVLAALARALRLDDTELAHLRSVARPDVSTDERPERLRPGTRAVLDNFYGPALVYGRRTDVLAWNRAAHALFASHLEFRAPERDRPNLARLVLLDPRLRELYVDWENKAEATVAYLRVAVARHAEDRELKELVGELSARSGVFARLWADHAVTECVNAAREYRHPVVGRMVLRDETVVLPEDPGLRLALFTAKPGSPSEAALRRLGNHG